MWPLSIAEEQPRGWALASAAESAALILILTDKQERQRTSLSFGGRRAPWMSLYVERDAEREEKKGPSGSRKSEGNFRHSQETSEAKVSSFTCTQYAQSRGGEGKFSPALLVLPCKEDRMLGRQHTRCTLERCRQQLGSKREEEAEVSCGVFQPRWATELLFLLRLRKIGSERTG